MIESTSLEYLIEDKIEEVLAFLTPLSNENGIQFNPYFTSGPEEDINPFLITETATNIYPLIWFAYPCTEIRTNSIVKADNVRLILAIENSKEVLNKARLQSSYKKILYPLFYDIRRLFIKANNIEVYAQEYSLTKFPNYGQTKQNFYQTQKSESVEIWDVLAVDFGIKVTKFQNGLV
tara:strand:- start:8968 stop:9501 length:534 start_codon:yes stop_codon:yes gene_type:complete